MKRDSAELSNTTYDVAVIGGGILGAGIARDAALRGLSVALVEKGDFASGTSSRSTKLVHGGLRYLEQLSLGLVAESCRERSILLEMAPHLVSPLSFLLPAYKGDPRSLTMLRLGTTVYDWLTSRNSSVLPKHQTLSPRDAVAAEPALRRDALRGAVLFYDCQMDDARLCLETILDACQHGACCVNYCEVVGLRKRHRQIEALQVVDNINGEAIDLKAKCFVNATGPWIESVGRLADRESPAVSLSPTKGVHLVVPRLNHEHGIYFQSKQDGRMIFLLPWGEYSLLGTTDTSYTKAPDAARAEHQDVEYLFKQLQGLTTNCQIGASDVIGTFAGVRALIRSDGLLPSKRSREERITLTSDNLISVAGGKYTTFRSIADKVVRRAYKVLQQPLAECLTAQTPLIDRRPPKSGQQVAPLVDVFESDVEFACSNEMAVTVEDFMRRRSSLALSRHGGADVATRVSHLMARQLKWNEETRQVQLSRYLHDRELSLPQKSAEAG